MPAMPGLGVQQARTVAGAVNPAIRIRVDGKHVQETLEAFRKHAPHMMRDVMDDMSKDLLEFAKGHAPVDTGAYQASLEAGLDRRGSKTGQEVVRAYLKATVSYAVYVEYQYHKQTGLWGCVIPVLEMYQQHARYQVEAKLFEKMRRFKA